MTSYSPQKTSPLHHPSWAALEKQAATLSTKAIDLSLPPLTQPLYSSHLRLDCSHQQMHNETFSSLLSLAEDCKLAEHIAALMEGGWVNTSEERPALHTALRVKDDTTIFVNQKDIMPQVYETRQKIREIAEQVRNGEWLGATGKPIANIVNIGIGGSDLGPRLCISAFSALAATHLGYHFISDADPLAFERVAKHLQPETTLFLISSKSFKTPETLYNTKKALAWLGSLPASTPHCIAITANPTEAKKWGFDTILPIWDWVGGRYSLCSAINLITAIAIGFDGFSELLAGASLMDTHFRKQPFESNLPVILGLMGIWNNNFLHSKTLLLLVYLQQLELFVPYIQQLDMESNGKSLTCSGERVNYATGPIVWGGLGNQAQHSYYQLLCQGTHRVATDFITLKSSEGELIHQLAEAKKKVLSQGIKTAITSPAYIPGNQPINHIELLDCSPFALGQLISLYEHKIYTQSVIWGINAFDQPGVESAKRQGLVI